MEKETLYLIIGFQFGIIIALLYFIKAALDVIKELRQELDEEETLNENH